MNFPRASGILLHPTTLPGSHGVGDFGPEAYRFVEFLHAAGQKFWQVLPLNPTGYADSPFQCFSASAGNQLLISLDRLADQGLLSRNDLRSIPVFPVETVDYGAVIRFKVPLLQKAATNFFASASAEDRRRFEGFSQANATWLDDFVLFMAVKGAHHLVAWTRLPSDVATRENEAMKRCMNLPGISVGNWKWRMKPGAATTEIATRLEERLLSTTVEVRFRDTHGKAN